MSLRVRLALLLVAVVTATVLLAWAVTGRAVLAPFADAVLEVWLDQAVFVAERIEAGESGEELGKRLGLEIRIRDRPPPAPGGERMRRRCREEQRRGHAVVFCRGARAPTWVETGAGWVQLRRDLDVERPRERIGRFLLWILLSVVLASIWVAHLATRPLARTQKAMARIAAGDLEHRLRVEGPPELKEAARAFNQMAERIIEMLRAERSLMAGISHELRTPLARLRLELEILGDQGSVAEKRLAAMSSDLDQVDRLIGELLEISRLSIGERTISRAPVDLLAVVHEAAARPEIAGREVRIEGAADPIEGDHDRLVRVVANLIVNAAKYSPPDQPIEVRVAGRSIAVLDRGPGVGGEELERIFEPFYRAGGGAPGLGLGLAIAKQIVELHGGTITAEPREGGGLAVRIEFLESP